jgi:hypothetical protein
MFAEAYMHKVKGFPPQEMFLGLTVGSTVLLVEIFLIALLGE